ncbi:hypothetical protein CPB86DRAFT_788134 [Serendipita vermifera]|nr:hypothetical protein CPB86DRAFT_788134 [Serendipita vermifera]
MAYYNTPYFQGNNNMHADFNIQPNSYETDEFQLLTSQSSHLGLAPYGDNLLSGSATAGSSSQFSQPDQFALSPEVYESSMLNLGANPSETDLFATFGFGMPTNAYASSTIDAAAAYAGVPQAKTLTPSQIQEQQFSTAFSTGTTPAPFELGYSSSHTPDYSPAHSPHASSSRSRSHTPSASSDGGYQRSVAPSELYTPAMAPATLHTHSRHASTYNGTHLAPSMHTVMPKSTNTVDLSSPTRHVRHPSYHQPLQRPNRPSPTVTIPMHRPSQSLSALSSCLGREEENIPLSSYVRHGHGRNLSMSSSISASSAGSDSLKRKREQSLRKEMVPVEEDDDSASEDEYQDDCGSYEDDESDEYDEDSRRRGRKALAKGRLNKKRRVSSDVDAEGELDYSLPPTSGSSGSPLYRSPQSAPLDHGASIKVTQLIPINKQSKSCPHCNFVPANGRFSDLKRHHQKHLVDESDEKERWVCLCCGTLTTDPVDGKIEYIPHGNAKLTRYTRKDSAKRHWKRAHGVKGMVWDEALVCTVDRVRGEDNWEVSGPVY